MDIGELQATYPKAGDLKIGQRFGRSLTVTEAHVVLASGLFGDFAPLHVDELFAKATRYGQRLVHGTLVTGMMAGALTQQFGPNAMGFLEEHAKFVAPGYIGDTLETVWTITDVVPKDRLGGSVVYLDGVCSREDGTVVVQAEVRLIVAF